MVKISREKSTSSVHDESRTEVQHKIPETIVKSDCLWKGDFIIKNQEKLLPLHF